MVTNIFQSCLAKVGFSKKICPATPRGRRGAPAGRQSWTTGPRKSPPRPVIVCMQTFPVHLRHLVTSNMPQVLGWSCLAPLRQVHLSETESGDRKVLNCQFRSQLLSPRPPRGSLRRDRPLFGIVSCLEHLLQALCTHTHTAPKPSPHTPLSPRPRPSDSTAATCTEPADQEMM